MTDQDGFLEALVERLRSEHGCHTVILYGSRARGDATAESDWDLIGFRDGASAAFHDTGLWRGERMDVFVYSSRRLEQPDAQLIHIRGGKVLAERGAGGHALLQRLDDIHARGPEPLPADAIAARRAWAWKTLDRASRGDLEANYRRAWLLTQLLEDYFLLRGAWYPGSKAAFTALGESDPQTHALFDQALAPNASLAAIGALVERVSGPRDGTPA